MITQIDGKDVDSIATLAAMVDAHNVGDRIKLTVVRDGKTMELAATLQEWAGS